MAAYRWVYDSSHLQADCQELGSGTLHSAIEYGLSLPFYSCRAKNFLKKQQALGNCSVITKTVMPFQLVLHCFFFVTVVLCINTSTACLICTVCLTCLNDELTLLC